AVPSESRSEHVPADSVESEKRRPWSEWNIFCRYLVRNLSAVSKAKILVLYRKRTGDDSFGRASGVAPVRFRYSDLNEAGRVYGGCAVYVISIALGRAHVGGNRLFSRLCGAPRWPWK